MSPITSTLANGSAYGYRTLAGGANGSYESIATATGTGSSATITFSSIPSTYKHLQIRGITRTTTTTPEPGNTYWDLTINGDTGTNYATHRINGDGTSATALGLSAQTVARIYSLGSRGSDTNRVGAVILDIIDYASTTKNKTIRAIGGIDTNGANSEISLTSGLWINTSAITSITITIGSGNFATNSTIALYGIKGA